MVFGVRTGNPAVSSVSNKKARRKTAAKYLWAVIAFLVFGVFATQLWAFHRYAKGDNFIHNDAEGSRHLVGRSSIRRSRYNGSLNRVGRNNISKANSNAPITPDNNVPPSQSPKVEYLMFDKDETYMRNCEKHIKGNHTWGKQHAPYVDKLEAKNIVESMKVPHLKVIPTLAVLDKDNITSIYTLDFMKSLKQPYIIKSTHMSGG